MVIILDTREQEEEQEYFIRNGIEFRRETLSCGDYAAEDADGNRVVIERKEIKDFISSMFEGRLDSQLSRLASERLPILFISGKLEEYFESKPDSQFQPEQFYGAISSAIVRYGLRCVIWNQCENSHEDSLGIIARILNKVSENKLDNIPNRKTKEYSSCVGYLRTLLNCTQQVAIDLLKKYGNIRSIINASDDQLKEFKGIGPKKVERMRLIIDGKNTV